MILTKLKKKLTKKNLLSTAVLRIITRMSSILVFKKVRISNYWSSMAFFFISLQYFLWWIVSKAKAKNIISCTNLIFCIDASRYVTIDQFDISGIPCLKTENHSLFTWFRLLDSLLRHVIRAVILTLI